MEDQYGVCDSSQSEIENPLLWPMLEILKKQPSGWKVHTLTSKLSECGYINQLAPRQTKTYSKETF